MSITAIVTSDDKYWDRGGKVFFYVSINPEALNFFRLRPSKARKLAQSWRPFEVRRIEIYAV